MLKSIRKHLPNQRSLDEGATATEYVLLLTGIAALIIASVFALGHLLNGKFTSTSTAITQQK